MFKKLDRDGPAQITVQAHMAIPIDDISPLLGVIGDRVTVLLRFKNKRVSAKNPQYRSTMYIVSVVPTLDLWDGRRVDVSLKCVSNKVRRYIR